MMSAIIPVMENQGRIGKEEDIYPLMLKVFPEKELKLCPEKLVLLMGIGASPTSTGGGMKTTTVLVYQAQL